MIKGKNRYDNRKKDAYLALDTETKHAAMNYRVSTVQH